MIFIISHLSHTLRQWVLTEHCAVDSEVTINNYDDLFVASEKRKIRQCF